MRIPRPERIRFVDLGASHSEIRDSLDAAWTDTLETGEFIGGTQVETFEAEWAAFCHAETAVAVANGTDALELILRGLNIGKGDEVIIPTNTFTATAQAVVAAGAQPVFTDIDPVTGLITGDHVRAALTRRTAAVMPVHLYGQMVDIDDISSVAERAGLAVIEDAAQAHGATWRGQRAGSAGIAAAFSFYPGKNLGALGDAGAVTTSDPALARRIRSLANHGRSVHSKFEHDISGRNSRLDGLQAATLRVKLPELERWNKARRAVAEAYMDDLPDSFVPYFEAAGAQSVFHVFVVRTVDVPRKAVLASLDHHNIEWGIHYPVPCHKQRPFSQMPASVLHTAETHAEQVVSLPMHPHLTRQQVGQICAALRAVT